MKNKGIIYAAIAAIAFSTGGIVIKLLPCNSLSIVSGRSFFAAILYSLIFIFTKKKVVINRVTIFGGIFVFLNMTAYILAMKLTSSANTAVLEYTAPIYILLFNIFFKHKKAKKIEIFVLLGVIFGVILLMYDGLESGQILGNLIALASGMIYALVIMLNEFKGGDNLSSLLIGQILACLFGLSSLMKETSFSGLNIILIVYLGFVQSGLGYLLLTLAGKYTDAFSVSITSYLEPLLSPLLVMIFYGEKISLLGIIGVLIVLISVIYYNISAFYLNAED